MPYEYASKYAVWASNTTAWASDFAGLSQSDEKKGEKEVFSTRVGKCLRTEAYMQAKHTDCNDCSPFAHPKVLPDTALQAIISSAGALERCSSVFGTLDLKFRLSRINIGMKEVIQHGMGNNKHISAPIHQPLIAAHMRCLPK